MADLFEIELVAGAVEQLYVVAQRVVQVFAEQPLERRVVQVDLMGLDLMLSAQLLVALKGDDLRLLAVVNALELPAGAHGPVAGVGLDAELVFQLIEQLEGIARLAVHLVDKRKNRDMAHGADLEKLPGLRLDALGSVDDHDGGVRGHQRAVGVFGEVLVARGVENIDAVALVLELHDRGGYGDAALLFNFHPVGNGVARIFFALDGAGELNGASVQKELFGKRRFAGVRMRNNRKGAAFFDLLSQIWQSDDLCFYVNSNNRFILSYMREKFKFSRPRSDKIFAARVIL